jgi:Arc/MetJ-type ribon-helix-helix transcriptional regulator
MWRSTFRNWLTLGVVVSVFSVAGCGSERGGRVSFAGDSTAAEPLADGDVRIISTDGALILAVIGDSVVIQMSDSVRQAVRSDIQNEAADAGRLGAMIGNAVGAAVNAALGISIRVPAENVTNLRYENGNLRFDVYGGPNVKGKSGGGDSANTISNGNNNSGVFTEADAAQFIDAVRAAQARRTAM